MTPSSRPDLIHLSNPALVAATLACAQREREATQNLIDHLAEVDRRQVYLKEGFRSLHEFAVQVLKLSDGAAHRRIQAVRLSAAVPEVIEQVRQGELTLSNVAKLQDFFTAEGRAGNPLPVEDKRVWLKTAEQLSTRELDAKIQEEASAPVKAVLQERVKVVGQDVAELKMVVSQEFLAKLEELKNFWSHSNPGASKMELLEKALDRVLTLEKKKHYGSVKPPETEKKPQENPQEKPRENPRTFPARVRRRIWDRAHGQCEFESPQGRRCEARSTLELDHVVPRSRGGASTFENGRLLCRAHNNARVYRFPAEAPAPHPAAAHLYP